ncbi:M56 family metallopeptidase [Niabella beijingensis]|uniref:M56 family metallopeptidase n=1 Tax=Niabella beijingensis TaxID=2872700 RepID=UPI001CBFFE87|nr:M56 family metallopeptidase [Niabella beijingensis]MBZ4187269.1 M56 family metallopeptidase [Niabella beijingensis]
MIGYLLKVITCSGLLYVFYVFFLQKEKMLVFNRFYLLACLVVPFLLPLLKLETTVPDYLGLPAPPFEELHMIPVDPVKPSQEQALPGLALSTTGKKKGMDTGAIVFFSISILLLIRFVRNLLYYRRLLHRYPKIKKEHCSIVLLDADVSPHSFLRTIFLNRLEYEGGRIDDAVLMHEEAHIKQRHSWDILFTELLIVACWVNPFLFFFKRLIRTNHEFLADARVVQYTGNRNHYQELVLRMASLKAGIPLSSSFYSVTKKRLIMLYKESSTKVKRTKGLIALFVFIPLLAVFANPVNGRGLKLNEPVTYGNMADLIRAAQKKVAQLVVPDFSYDTEAVKSSGKDPKPLPAKEGAEKETIPAGNSSEEIKNTTTPEPMPSPVVNLRVQGDSSEIPYRSYPVNKGLAEAKMMEFGKFIEKYVMEDKGEKVFWYKQMLRPALDLYFGMTDEQRGTVNEKLPGIFLAAKQNQLVQVNEKYKNNDRRIIVVYPDGRKVTTSVATDEDRTRFLEGLGLHLGKKRFADYASRTYVYNGKPVTGYGMLYMAKR